LTVIAGRAKSWEMLEPPKRNCDPRERSTTRIEAPLGVHVRSPAGFPPVVLSSFKFSSASSRDVEGGLLGWVSFELNGVLGVDGCAVRRTRDGRTMVSFPTRKASDGTRHPDPAPARRRDPEPA
jgi:hypothetical protein